MLTNYENKVSLPDTKNADTCPSCKGTDWKMVVRKGQKYLVCKRCGHVKKGK
jgi:uncharacterized Zn finger protein